MYSVVILMATYNGEKFIEKQLDSIINQTYKKWNLFIHDDGSTDNTKEILKKYKNEYPDKINIIEDGKRFKSPKKNFFYLAKIAKKERFDYILFCDQDDIWKDNKIEVLLKSVEKENKDIPIVIHSDSRLIDSRDNELSSSFDYSANLNKSRNDFFSIAIWNVAQGCSMLINRKCLDYIDIDLEMIEMHDWWFCIIAAMFGKILYEREPLLDYRQHGNNCVGGKDQKRIIDVIGINKFIEYKNKTKKSYNKVYKQLISLKKYYNIMNENTKKQLEDLIKIMEGNICKRILFCIREKMISKKGIKTCVGFILFGRK